MKSRTPLVYAGLILAWGVIVGWQAVEHYKVVEDAKAALVNRGRDITSSIIRTLRGSITATLRAQLQPWERDDPNLTLRIPREAVQAAVDLFANWRGVISLELLNLDKEVIASAGADIADVEVKRAFRDSDESKDDSVVQPLWDERKGSVTIANPVSLEPTSPQGEPVEGPIRVLPQVPPTLGGSGTTNATSPATEGRGDFGPGPDRGGRGFNGPGGGRGGRGGPGSPSIRLRRPSNIPEEEWRTFLQRSEIHAFLIVMSTESVLNAAAEDYRRRLIICGFGLASVIGLGLAWGFSNRTGELQVRLVRASEMNTHLREMNLAAAGLAHETRNPLNIIRGLAQMISKSSEGDVRTKSREITEEVDRVSAQLNEFINYSKPREVRRAPVQLGRVIGDVVRALKDDVEEKKIALQRMDEEMTVEADQGMLRQVLFNLLINAIQFVGDGGEIQVVATKTGPNSAFFEVRDNGPGVPPENRESIFQPYFTTRVTGTGLGLAVVKQIIEAHGWEIECLSNGGKGSVFRVSRLVLAADSRAREKKSNLAGV